MISGLPIETDKYYQQFEAEHGYADKDGRGHGHGIVNVAPIGDVDEEPTSDSYVLTGIVGTTRDGMIDRERRLEERRQHAKGLVASLRELIGKVGNRIHSRPTAAVREALADAQAIIAGAEPNARGGRNEILQGLVTLLGRYA